MKGGLPHAPLKTFALAPRGERENGFYKFFVYLLSDCPCKGSNHIIFLYIFVLNVCEDFFLIIFTPGLLYCYIIECEGQRDSHCLDIIVPATFSKPPKHDDGHGRC